MIRKLLFLLLLLHSAVPASASEKPDLLLITVDTLRADRLGCYGYTAAETPGIDRLASEGILFTNAVSPVPQTRPSHISLFTGLYPFEHGIHDNIAAPLNPKIPLLAEILRQNGYRTAAFVAAFVVNSQSGLNRGFDVYEEHFDAENQPTQFALNLEKRGDQVYREFSSWYSQKKAGPYFAWVHLYDPHFPYEPPAEYRKRFAGRPYDGEVAYSDEMVGKILKLVDHNTIVILTSDHGEALGDHGENTHGYYIYDATQHVPLIVRWPGSPATGRKVPHQVRLIDLFPTILDLSGIATTARVSGTSLKPWLTDPGKSDPMLYAYSESYLPWIHFGWSRLQGVRYQSWKYIQAPRPELYDLARDPRELQNTVSSESRKANILRDWLTKSGAAKEGTLQAAPELDPETLEKLAALGYAGVSSPPPPADNLPDPKDRLEDFKLFNKLIREGIEDFQAGRYTEAASKFQTLLDRKVPSFEVHYYLGRSLLRLKSYDKSSTELRKALEKLPHFLPAYRDLSEAYDGLGKPQEAEAALLAGLGIAPDLPYLAYPLAWKYQLQKKYADAAKLLESVLRKHPEELEARYRLGAIRRDTGQTEEAMQQFRGILSLHPEEAEAHNQLGMLYGGSGRLREALAEFTEASRLDPANENYRKNLELIRSRTSGATALRFLIIQTRTKTAAEALLRKLQNGEPWERLAPDYSVHPSARSGQPILEASPSELDPEIAQALESLQPGRISAVIETRGAYFIVKRQ